MVVLISCAGAYLFRIKAADESQLTPSRPDFDSPSVFGRMYATHTTYPSTVLKRHLNTYSRLDKDKGGHFTISPVVTGDLTTKQQYLPSNNILQTRYLHEDGVLNLLDFFPR